MSAELLVPPFPYFGAKPAAVVEMIWRALGDVGNYVEPFFGSGRVLLGRPAPGKVETVNDLSGFVANFWRAVARDPEAVAAACDRPVNEIDLRSIHRWLMSRARVLAEKLEADPDFFEAKVAGWWAWGASSWIGAGWCTGDGSIRHLPHLSRDNEGHPGGGQGVHKATMRQLPRQMPMLAGPGDGSGVGYGCGINTRDRRDRLVEWFLALAARLRHVRVCCGDFERILSPAVTVGHGLTGVVLDPPYARDGRATGLYVGDRRAGAEDEREPAIRAREWALSNGADTLLRIVLCEYDDGFTWPDGWHVHPWKAKGGYGNQAKSDKARGRANAHRERLVFSPHCFPVSQQIGLGLDLG